MTLTAININFNVVKRKNLPVKYPMLLEDTSLLKIGKELRDFLRSPLCTGEVILLKDGVDGKSLQQGYQWSNGSPNF